MKNLILISGTMGVGKTATGRELQKLLPHCAFLDGDWCWDMAPFIVNDETKNMVLHNIGCLLNNFIGCSVLENIVFCWVMHEQAILDAVLSQLDTRNCIVHKFSLVCSEESLILRIARDVEAGVRTADVMGRSIPRLKNYRHKDTYKIDVSAISAKEAAKMIAQHIADQGR